jgi:nucleotide-binding universal stress UspA family protein
VSLDESSGPNPGKDPNMNSIVVGYDGTEYAERALARAAELAQALAAKLIVVSVGRSPLVMAPEPALELIAPDGGAGPLVAGRTARTPARPALQQPDETLALLERARRFLGPRDVDADFLSEIGDPVECLLQVADDRDADLIVVGSRERSFLAGLLGGGIDDKLVRRAHRDLLLVH